MPGTGRGLIQRSEIKLAGGTICRPFAPDGEFRHIPSSGRLKLKICQSIMTRKRSDEARTRLSNAASTDHETGILKREVANQSCRLTALVLPTSNVAHRTRKSYSLLSAEYHVQSATLAGNLPG
jgi:hypothetical protein